MRSRYLLQAITVASSRRFCLLDAPQFKIIGGEIGFGEQAGIFQISRAPLRRILIATNIVAVSGPRRSEFPGGGEGKGLFVLFVALSVDSPGIRLPLGDPGHL